LNVDDFLAIVLYVHLRFTASDCPIDTYIFKLFLTESE
jgi:hypothetical protein